MGHWHSFLALILISLVVQGFFCMLEMACVSFNRVRLQYYVSKNSKRAIWLNRLLQHPSTLFGTTLVGVNASLQFGSECARRFYDSIGLSPDFAPLSQVIIVLIFAELAPMFAARRYAEHVVMWGIGPLYLFSIVMKPFIAILDLICRLIDRLFGIKTSVNLYLTREELQKAFELRETKAQPEQEDFETLSMNIFSLKKKTAKDLMEPLNKVEMISSEYTVAHVRSFIKLEPLPFLLMYHFSPENIVAVTFPRDLLRLEESASVRPHSRSPWFLTEKTPVLEILKQFRRNNQSLAVVLNEVGLAVGVLTLDTVIDEIFGTRDQWISFGEYLPEKHRTLIDRSFEGATTLEEINKQLPIPLKSETSHTLEEFMEEYLGRRIEQGDTIFINGLEFTVAEGSLLGKFTISIRTRTL